MELMALEPTARQVAPSGWRTDSLESMVEPDRPISYGIVQTGPAVMQGVPCLRVVDIRNGRIDSSNLVLTSAEISKAYGRTVLKNGDLVMPLRGKVGEVAIAEGVHAGFNLTRGVALIAPRSEVHGEYLKHFLSAPTTRTRLEQSMNGSALQEISIATLRSFSVDVPNSRAEQEAIAEALSDADALIESLSLLLAKKRQIKQGAMQELLTGTRRLPGFEEEWARYEIGEVAEPSTEVNVHGEALPVLACSKHLGFVDSLGFFKNQVFSRDTASYKIVRRGQIGYPANHIEEGSIGLQDLYDVALVSPIYVVFSVTPRTDSYFLHRLLKLDQYRQTFSSATAASVDRRGSLRWPEFSKINVMLPSHEEQRAIRQVLQEVEAETAAVEAMLEKARSVKHGMMQELFTGRVRLVQPAADVIPLPLKSAGTKQSSIQPTHNWQINEAVVIGVLAQRFGSEQFPLPRKRRVKLTYLLHRHAEGRAEGYLKKAAGPYDPNTKYKGPEQIALKNGYVRAFGNGTYEGFVAGHKIEQAQRYFEQWYGAAALEWLERFHYRKTDDLELLATVDMAMVDLAANGEPADVSSIKRVIAAHPEWLPKLSRELFSDERIAAAIAECRTLFGG